MYTVRFLNYAGDDLLGVVTCEAGADITDQAPTPEVFEGKTFTGWNVPITNIQEDMTVRPTYKTATYTVNFYGFDCVTVISTQTIEYGKDATAPEPEVVIGKDFVKWDKDYANVKADLDVYPVYKDTVLTVLFFDKDGATVLSQQSVIYGNSAVAPTPKVYERAIFLKWDKNYSCVISDLDVYSVYREVPAHPLLSFYKKNDDETSGELIKTYRGVNACSITQKLDGECTIDFKLTTKLTENVVSVSDRLEVDGLVFYVTELKKSISGGICYSQFTGEHISYLLNNDAYKVEAFDMEAAPAIILAALLEGTPFTIGTVDFTEKVTLRANKSATRRACVMQLIALVGGEIEYYGYTIGIRKHLGNTTPINIMKSNLVQDISYNYNVSEDTTSYSLSLYQKSGLSLGDELKLKFDQLGIADNSRIVGFDWNPFNYKEVSITVGSYLPTINDSLYQIETAVADVTQASAKYTVEFGELVGNGKFYFTRAYLDRPYFQVKVNDDSSPTITLMRKDGSAFGAYVGAELSGVTSTTVTLVVFYCTVPDDTDDN